MRKFSVRRKDKEKRIYKDEGIIIPEKETGMHPFLLYVWYKA